MTTRTVLIIAIIFYLTSLGIILSLVDVTNMSGVTTQTNTVIEGFPLVNNIASIPWQFNLLFITFPLAILIYLVVEGLIPTVNAGA